jgi:glycine/D-amino acid oxidase-like deaminating enzyme
MMACEILSENAMRRREFLAGVAALSAPGALARVPAHGEPQPRVGVIGAGIVGASIALHLAERGARVTLLERDAPASGATQNSFGFLNIFDLDRHYQKVRQKSVLAYRQLDTPLQLAITWGGYINWTGDASEARTVQAYAAMLDGTPDAVRRLDAEEFHRISPAITPGPIAAAFYSPLAGQVDPVWVTYRFLDRARLLGAHLRYGCEVLNFKTESGRLRAVSTRDGLVPVDRVVIAAGVDTPRLLSLVGFTLRLRHAPGILAHSVPIPELTKIIYDGPGGMEFKQMASGRIVGTDSLEAPDISVHQEIRRHAINFPDDALRAAHGNRILQRITTVMPGARAATLDRLTLGFRPMPTDGFPVIGAVPGVDDVYVAVTHSGVTLAPILGQYASQEVLTGARIADLAPYRPERFAATPAGEGAAAIPRNPGRRGSPRLDLS